MRNRVIAMYVILLNSCDSHSARSYMPGASACAAALTLLPDPVFCLRLSRSVYVRLYPWWWRRHRLIAPLAFTRRIKNLSQWRKLNKINIIQFWLTANDPHHSLFKDRDLPLIHTNHSITSRFCVFSDTLLRPFFELGHTKQLARPDSTVGIHLPYSAWITDAFQKCHSTLRPKPAF